MNHDNDTPIDADISDLYQSTRSDEPGAALDAAILAQAQAAVVPKRRPPVWMASVGIAATLLLGVNLAVNLKDYTNEPDVYSEAAYPAPPQTGANESANQKSSAAKRDADNYDHYGDPDEASVAAKAESSLPRDIRNYKLRDVAPLAARESADGTSRRNDVTTDQADPGPASTAPLESVSPPRLTMPAISSDQAVAGTNPAQNELDDQAANRSKTIPMRPAAEPKQMARYSEPALPNSSEEREIAKQHSSVSRELATLETAPTTVASESDSAITPQQQPAAAVTEQNRSMASVAPEPSMDAVAATSDTITQDDKVAGVSGLEEIVVTGSSVSRVDESPHRRLTAKGQALRNRQLEAERSYSTAPQSVRLEKENPGGLNTTAGLAASPQVYVCNLTALGVTTDTINAAKTETQSIDPPINAQTWPRYIRMQADARAYASACAHLAAFRQLYPYITLEQPFPIALSSEKP